MNSIKLNKDVCRICLKHNLKLNWNDEIFEFCGISYKHCYYKYTNLEELDSECYPTNLCEICANGLKNAHMLFEKALESFNILQDVIITEQIETKYSDMDDCNSIYTMKCEIQRVEEVMDDTAPIHTEYETKDRTENKINYSDKISVIECTTVEPTHFIDIQTFESSDDTALEQQLYEISDVKQQKLRAGRNTVNRRKKGTSPRSFTSKRFSKTRRNPRSLNNNLLKQQLKNCFDTELLKSSYKNAANEINNNKSSDETLLEQNPGESENNDSILTVTEPKKFKKKNFMCAYCSLKTYTASKLEEHEATHNENRERTETCPQCGVKLFTKFSLSIHMKTHDENRQKDHKCEFCEKAFFNKGALNVHKRIHLGLMVKCHLCPKEYFRQVDLNKHLLSHSETPLQKNVGKKKYAIQCQYCNKSVETVKWRAHLAAHLNQPEVKCKICEKNFFSRNNCSRHLRRFHHKNASEYDDFIHYYDQKKRINVLVIKQQLRAQPLIENQVP